MVAAVGIELHLHLTGSLCTGTSLFHILDDMARPAAISHKRDHSLAGEILPVEEGLDRGGHGVPPGRSAHGNHIVVGRVYGQRLQLRFIAAVDLALALIDHFIVAAGIGNSCVDFEQVAAGNALQLLGDALSVAVRPGIINDQQFFHGGLSFVMIPAAYGRRKNSDRFSIILKADFRSIPF